jgi:hypothetical protein
MRIAERPALLLAGMLALGTFEPRCAGAHPVAQGALDIAVSPERVHVVARVSMEEVLVAAAHGESRGVSAADMVRRHGGYLLAHLRIAADERPLAGALVGVRGEADGQPVYELEYRGADGAPERITVQQDVLREFEFAPGNPWEASYVVRAGRQGQRPATGRLLTSREPLVIDLRATATPRWVSSRVDGIRLAGEFARHGTLHILSGYDHLFFVAALALAVATLWDLLKVVSVFTLAHSLTLTLSVLDVVRLPGSVVEPMIAASIVLVALENVVLPERARGAGRLGVAFFFGLFHGLGFAGGLLSAMEGMGGPAAGLAIVAFSVGVEVGHQVVVLPLFLGLAWLRRRAAPGTRRVPAGVVRYGSAGILAAGIVYLFAALQWT